MSDENLREVFRAFRDAQDKYVYFILAAAGAAIGLALNKTEGASLSWTQLPLAGAATCWGLSFYFGCRHLAYVGSTLYANAELLRVQRGDHPEVGNNLQIALAASRGISQAMETNSERASRLGLLQFRFLIVGAILYISWHVLEMYLRSQPR